MDDEEYTCPPLGAMYGVANKGFEDAVCCDALDGGGNRITFLLSPTYGGYMGTVIFHKDEKSFSGQLIPTDLFAELIQTARDKQVENDDIPQ